MNTLRLPPELTPALFLKHYWQQQPLLIRQAFRPFSNPISGDELAGLACEQEVESRIVLEHGATPWEARHGPFDEEDFTSLPESHWTLLVQDVDKWVPEIAELLQNFRFIPDWRIDDIMISYAVDQGSVGPHTDAYDVFLIQAQGRRRWRIDTADYSQAPLVADISLRILQQMNVEHDWLMEPGDMLYLPPGIAHWGVAEGDDCMTFSVGIRAPSLQEMTASWCDHLLEQEMTAVGYRDPPLSPQIHSAEIQVQSAQQAMTLIQQFLRGDPEQQQVWFGRFVTELKGHQTIAPPLQPLTAGEVIGLLQQTGLRRHSFSRFAFAEGEAVTHLFTCGQEHRLPQQDRELVIHLCEQPTLHWESLSHLLATDTSRQLLQELYNLGYLHEHGD